MIIFTQLKCIFISIFYKRILLLFFILSIFLLNIENAYSHNGKPLCAIVGTVTVTPACGIAGTGTATITLTGDGSGALGTYSLDGAAAVAFITNPFTITGLSAGSHSLLVIVTASGCVSDPINFSTTIANLPTIQAVANPTVSCSGSPVNLTASGASSFSWNPGALSGASVTVNPTTTTTYTLAGTSSDGCIGGNIWMQLSTGGYHGLGIKSNGTLWTWGENNFGQIGDGTLIRKPNPIQIGTDTDWVMVSGGNYHSLAIKSDGTLWAWGYNLYGQLGDGTTIDKYTPVQVGTASDWMSVSAGGAHSMALKSNGTLWTWGYNNYGQLGDGTFVNKSSPVQIGVATNWTKISAGSDHCLALNLSDAVYSWGRNSFGQLGNGTTATGNSPALISGLTAVKQIAAAYYHSLAILSDGSLMSWGYNNFGQLGDGTTTQRLLPIPIAGSNNWTKIDGGLSHTVATRTDGTLWAWGYNVYGQIGDASTTTRTSPVQIGSATNWLTPQAGIYHSQGLKPDGSLFAWGYNNVNQLGDGTAFSKNSPVQIGSTSVSVTVTVNPLPTVNYTGLPASLCLNASPVVLTGSPAGGTFSGTGIIGNTFNPVTAGMGTHSIQYNYTNGNGCTNSITKNIIITFSDPLDYANLQSPASAALCMGGSFTAFGQVFEAGLTEAPGAGAGITVEFGYNNSNTNPATWTNWHPAIFSSQQGNNDEYSATVILPSGTYYYAFRYLYVLNGCGYQYGGFADGFWNGTTSLSGVLTVYDLPTISATASQNSICMGSSTVLNASGADQFQWMPGALNGNNIAVAPLSNTAFSVIGTSSNGCSGVNTTLRIAAGSYHNLLVKSDASVWSGGENFYGQLGNGTNVDNNNTLQMGIASDWRIVSAGNYHSLAIKNNGSLWGWGINSSGFIGDGTTVDKNVPVQVGVATNWSEISAGSQHSLALKADGTLWAWGLNSYGQLGDGTATTRLAPIQIGAASDWAVIAAGGSHSLGIKKDGTLWAWGRNDFGQLGDGTTLLKNVPIQIGTATNWTKITAGFFHSLAIKSDGSLWGWGYNLFGQLGDGTTTNRTIPVQIGTENTWKHVDAGLYHNVAVKQNGTLWGWGSDSYGQTGGGTIMSQRNSPNQSGTSTQWLTAEAGAYHSIGLQVNGSYWVWGRNMTGQLADGTFITRSVPFQASNNTVNVQVNVLPLPTVGFTGLNTVYCTSDSAVTLLGTPGPGIFSGPGISGNQFNPSTAGIGSHSIQYSYTDGNGCTNSHTVAVQVNACAINVNLKLFLQGYYIDGGIMQPVLYNQGITAASNLETDSIIVELHDEEFFDLIDSKLVVLATNGTAMATFNQPADNYYIVIKHRNSIETWSAVPVPCSSATPVYDFSSSAAMAFANNQVLLQTGIYGIFTGDLNNDGFIDSNDFPLFDVDNYLGINGVYVNTDMNGDGFVDSNDFPLFDLNNYNGVYLLRP